MPAITQRARKKRPKNKSISNQEALDFAQLITRYIQGQKGSLGNKGQDKAMQFINKLKSLMAVGVSVGLELRAFVPETPATVREKIYG